MADEEAELDHSTEIGSAAAIGALRERLQELATELTESREPALNSASQYCQKFCQTLVEYAGRWKISEGPLPLVQVYMVAILSYAEARHQLSSECDNVSLVLGRLALSCVELLLALPEETPNNLWKEFQTSVQTAHNLLLEDGNSELQMLCAVAQESGVWTNSALQCILSKEAPQEETVNEFLRLEGPVLLEMRIKHLIKEKHIEKAASLAKACSDHLEFRAKSSFKQTYLVCLTAIAQQEQLMQEISEVDCKEALEMICNLESDGDEKAALSLCTAFLTRQLLQGDMYCAWELTLFWSKLQQRTEPSTQVFLDHCRQLSQLSKTVYHIFFLIKVIQSEVEDVGLAVCIELCIQALRMESSENPSIKATICKTISCLLPDDLEVKRACQLTEFLLEPTVESYYAVETLYNEPDQKCEVDNLPVPNSLRCELLLVFKTQWPFDPEFWDWKTLKRHCLELMGEEASIVSSIDELNDSEAFEQLEDDNGGKVQVEEFGGVADCLYDTPNVLNEMADEKQKKREIKKLREKGFISARFRNWQAYMQYCVLCDKEFLGHRIVRHAQKHVKDGVYSCPICGENFDQKELFVPHVTSHVKQSCKERLAAMKQSRTLGKPTKLPNSNTALQKVKAADKPDNRPKKKNSPHSHDIVVFNDKDASEGDGKGQCSKPDLSVHRVEYREEYTCPVTNCRKGFKYFKNLIAHVRGHKNSEEAKRFLEMQSKKVVCQYCRRQFVSVAHLNDHLQMHCGVKPYICIQLHCKSSFLTNPELLVHRKEHVVFKAKCMFPDCGRIFYEAYMLYDHEAQHYNTFTCKFPACGKIFHSQSKLGLHQEDHIAQQKTPCNEDKAAIQDSNLTELPDTNSDPSHTPLLEPNLVKLIDPNQIKLELPDTNPTQFKLELPDPSQSQLPHSNQITLPDPTQIQSELEIPCPNLTPLQDPTPVMNNCPQAVQINVEQEGKVAVINCKDSIHVCGSSQNSLPVMGVSSDVCVPASCEHLEPQPVQQPPLQRNGLPAELKESQLPDMLTGPLEEKPTELLHVKIEAPSNEEIMPEQLPKPAGDVVPNCNALSVRMPDGNNILSLSVHPQAATEKQVNVASQAKVVERFSCTFETCTRNYSSPKSVNKHMKAVHPEYHAALKLARKSKSLRKNNRKSALQSQTQEDKTQGMKTQTPLLAYQTGNVAATVSTPAFSSHSGTLTTQVFPTQIENVVNPILLSQMAEVSNQMLPFQKERGANPLLSLRMGSGLNLSHLSHKGHSAELPIHLQALASQVASSQITAANLVLSPQRPRGNTNNLVVNSQASVINPALTSQAVMFSEMQSSANLILSSQAESNCLPVLPSRLENSTDPILTPRLTDGTNSVVSHHIDSNAHSVHPAQVQRSADSLLPLQVDCGSHIGAPPTQGGSSHMAYSTMGSNNNLHVTSQVDSVTNIVLSQVDPSNPNLPSNMEGLSNALLPSLMERATHPLLPSNLESFKNAGQLETAVNPLFLPQVDARSLPDFSSQAERVANPQVENVMKSVFTSQPESAQTATAIQPLCGSPPKLEVKRTSKRTKWPAIVRDGKFICSRCYREFASPKSLGGHLSKRSHCKPFDETETSAAFQQDGSSSFITNQINSSSVLNVQQQQLSANLNPTASFKDQADQSLAIGNHPAEFLPSAIFPQVNGAVCNPNEGEQNSEVIKQALETAGLPNLFETPGILQQAFQNPCGPYQTSAHMPESTVIQHTGKAIKMESEDAEIPLIHETRNELTACAANHFVKAEEPEFCADIFSDSVLSQMLAEHNSQISLNNLGAAPLDQIITGSQSMKVEGNGEPQMNANDTLLAAMANLTQHFMVNHVLQIPAADPQHLVTNRCNPQDSAPKIKNVKKKLRAQLLEKPNDLSRKSSGPAQDISLQGNGHLQKIPSNFPQTSEALHGSAFSKIQGMTGSDNRGETNGLPSDTTQTEKLNSELNASLSGQTLSNAPDTSLSNSCDSQKEDEKIMEILTALQRLNLEKENTTDDSPAVNSCSVTSMLNCNAVVLNERPAAQHPDSTVTNKAPPLESPSKPFVCENESCPYSAMTKDALYKHYYKVHNYTEDMMNEIRQIQLKFAPFRCHICNKTFTRNSNLKAHFQTVHRLTQNKMVQLKIKRPYSKKSRPEKTATNKRPCMADGQQQEFGPEPAESTLALEKLKPTEGNSEQGMHPAVKESFKVTPTQVSCSLQNAPNGQTSENVSNSVLEQPTSGQPTVGLSAAQQPSAEYPTVDLPLAEQPAAQPPTVGQSVAGQPPVGLPVMIPSVAEPPVTTQSVAEPPVMTQSLAGPPVTTQSLAGPPVTTRSLAGPPVMTQSLAGPPVMTQSLAGPPVTTQSLAEPPVTTQSLAGPPVTTQSLAEPPVTTQSVAEPSVMTQSLAEPPVTTQSLAEPPVTTQSLAEPSVMTQSLAGPPVMTQSLAGPPVTTQSVAEPSVMTRSLAEPPVTTQSLAGPPVMTQSLAGPPVTTQSVAEPSVMTQSLAEPPVTTQSLAGPPVTTQSLAGPPVTTQSVAEPSVMTRSLAEPPVTTQSLAEPPVMTQSLAEPPVMTQSLAEPPVMTQSLAGPPVMTQSLAGPPVTTQSLAGPPVTTQSLAGPPVTTQSLAGPPVTTQSLAEPPVMTQSLAEPPVMTQSLAEPPVMTQSLAGPPVMTQSLAGPPVTTQSLAGPPVMTQSLAGPPVMTQSLAGLPVTTQSLAEPPVTTRSLAGPPVTTQSLAEPPVTTRSLAGPPVTTQSLAGPPVTTQSLAEPPVTTQSVAEPPVMTRSPPGPPIVEQPTVGLPMMGLPIAGQPLMELPVSGDTATGFPLPGPPLPGEPATGKVKKPKGPKPKVPKPKVEKLKVEKPKKQPKPEVKKQKKPAANTSESSHSYSPYRPYRCVHQGCFAAFTIQQNLILHYRAVHQSDLPKFEQDNEEESAEIKEELVEEINQITEFRCQVKDCSRIFQEVPSLLQHYTQLHEFSLEKAGRLLSDMNLGRFRCDQPECKASFTAFWKYIGHLEVDHEPEKLFNNDGEEGVFRCDCEGCDCVYATRSNLLRHLFRKHKDSHKSHLIRPRQKMDRQESYKVNGDPSKKSKSAGGKGDNEKENWQNNKKSKISSAEERKKKKNDANKTVWIKSEKTPSLKTNDEALAMCTKKFSLQYPCMIKGCLSVVSSERNIFRHYKTHRLTDAFLLQQGSDFIICKERSRPLKKSKSTGDGEKSQEDQSENSEEDLADAYPELHETESLRLTSEKDKVAEYTKPFKKKRSANECSEPKLVWRRKRTIRQAFPDSVPLIKRKRGRPPLKRKRKEAVQIKIKNRRVRKLKPELCNPSNLCSGSESATSSCTVPVQKEQQHNNIDLSTFKPMGFEVSFLKFLEESADQTKRKAKENPLSEIASKRKKYFPPKCGSLDCSESDLHIRTSGYHNLIDFQNPLNLQSVKNVKIILDRTFSEGAELLLKQLQEMRPTVVLEKW